MPREHPPRRISAPRTCAPRLFAPENIRLQRKSAPRTCAPENICLQRLSAYRDYCPGKYVPPEIIPLQRLFAQEHEFLSIRKTLSIAKLTFITTSKYYYFFPVSDFLYFIQNPSVSSRILPFPFRAGAHSALVGKKGILTHFIAILI